MAAAEAAPPPLSIPQPQIEPLSDDDGSSPLSDAPPDRDITPDDHIDHTPAAIHGGASPQSSDDELSDANDTEAETERLFDSPQVPQRQKDVVLNEKSEGRVYERTPSKLRHQDRTAARVVHDDDDDNDDDALSDADVSMASSPPAHGSRPSEKLPSPSLDLLAEAANQESESRKRKRSSAATEVEAEQPVRKRTGSVQAPGLEGEGDEPGSGDEDEDANPTPQTRSGDQSADETPAAVAAANNEHGRPPSAKARKHTRSGSRRIREQEAAAAAAATVDEHDPVEDNIDGTGPDEEAAHTGDDEPMADEADEEAEAAHRNEEERKSDKLSTRERESAC